MNILRKGFGPALLGTALAACSASLAWSQEQYWTYDDWTVHVSAFDTGEDWRVNCTAWTGGDGMPSVFLSASNGDAGPPDHYPQLTVHEIAPRHYPTGLMNGRAVSLSIDGKMEFHAVTNGYINDEGLAEAQVQVRWQDALEVLQWMRSGELMDIRTLSSAAASTRFTQVSLAGFTAAYGKMMDSCGHSLDLPYLN